MTILLDIDAPTMLAEALGAPAGPPRYVSWDDVAILKALGWTPQSVRAALISEKQGTPTQPSDWAIYQWTSRQKISSAWRPRLLYCALRLGRMELVQAFKVAPANA